MPIPKPSPTQTKDEFIKECMSNPIMVSEYSQESQRYAICWVRWKNK